MILFFKIKGRFWQKIPCTKNLQFYADFWNVLGKSCLSDSCCDYNRQCDCMVNTSSKVRVLHLVRGFTACSTRVWGKLLSINFCVMFKSDCWPFLIAYGNGIVCSTASTVFVKFAGSFYTPTLLFIQFLPTLYTYYFLYDRKSFYC